MEAAKGKAFATDGEKVPKMVLVTARDAARRLACAMARVKDAEKP